MSQPNTGSALPHGIKPFYRTFSLPMVALTLAPGCPFSLSREGDGYHVPYHEYRGNGSPNNFTLFGTPGDIYIDISEESYNLYARMEQSAAVPWKLWCGPAPTAIANEPLLTAVVGSDFHRSLIRYPFLTQNRYLWCDGKTIKWLSIKLLKISRSQIFGGKILPSTSVGTGAWLIKSFLDHERGCSQTPKRTISEINEPDETECKGPAKKMKYSESSHGQSQSKPKDPESGPSANGTSLSLYDILLAAHVESSVDPQGRGILDNEGLVLRGKQVIKSMSEDVWTKASNYSALAPSAENHDGIAPSSDALLRQLKDATDCGDIPNQFAQGRPIYNEGTGSHDILHTLLSSNLREPHIQNMTQMLKQVMEDARGEAKQMQDQMEREKASSQTQIRELESHFIVVNKAHASEIKMLQDELNNKQIRARSAVTDTQQQVQELDQSMILLKQQNAYLSEKLARIVTLHTTKVEALNKELEIESSLRKMAEEHMQTILSSNITGKHI